MAMSNGFSLEKKVDRVGERPFYKEYKGLADLINGVLDKEIPGHPKMSTRSWVRKFGQGAVDYTGLNLLTRQLRQPTIESLVILGWLMKESGANVEIYDFLLAAADGVAGKIAEHFSSEIPTPSHKNLRIPQEAGTGYASGYAVKVYESMSWDERLSAMQPLLSKIGRDTKFLAMTDDLDVIRELVKESVATWQTISVFAAKADLPYGWIKDILDSRWDEVRAAATVGMVLKLVDKVHNLDGKTGDAEFFAPLLTKDLQKEYRKNAKS